jgi:hypothetical protein
MVLDEKGRAAAERATEPAVEREKTSGFGWRLKSKIPSREVAGASEPLPFSAARRTDSQLLQEFGHTFDVNFEPVNAAIEILHLLRKHQHQSPLVFLQQFLHRSCCFSASRIDAHLLIQLKQQCQLAAKSRGHRWTMPSMGPK